MLQDDAYLLACSRYIELNPVRAGMVDHPGAYRWSSYRANGQGGAAEEACGFPAPEGKGGGVDAKE